MPADGLPLSRLIRRLGFKQQETFPTVESLQPVLTVGDVSSLVPTPRGPSCLVGCHAAAGPQGNTIRLFIRAPGGAWIEGVVGASIPSSFGFGSIEFWSIDDAVNGLGQFAAGPPAPRDLSPLTTSDPTAGPITTTARQGDSPIALPSELAPTFAFTSFNVPSPFPRFYVPSGTAVDFHTNDDGPYLLAHVQEIAEQHFDAG